LFYEESNYALAVKEFLASYYANKPFNFDSKVKGRCGYIRQAFPFEIADYDFTKVSLLIDGPNS
jgi:hypothetical protein